MGDTAVRKEAEAAEYRALLAKLTPGTTRDGELRSVYENGAQVASAEALAYRSLCSCVYAAVVRATPAALDRIAKRPEVRSVEPAPEVRRLDRAVFLPPLPEQRDVVRPPASSTSVSPSASPTAASTTAPTSADPTSITSPTSTAASTPSPTATADGPDNPLLAPTKSPEPSPSEVTPEPTGES
jgi:hypothetical protein